jgi:4-hydroxybenzoate polyprenyltransferase
VSGWSALCVDLDGGLLATDLLYESFVALLRTRPWEAWRVPVWLLPGKAHLKRQLAESTVLDVRSLPYREEVLDLLRQQRAEGRRIVLATAADAHLAQAVADHVGLFDDVIASDGAANLKGEAKRDALVERYGSGGFAYVAHGWEDVPVWRASAAAYAIQPSARLLGAVQAVTPEVQVLAPQGPTRSRVKAGLGLFRVHQWAKNVLIFLPLFTSHRLFEWPLFLACLVAFFSFSLGASALYILNDLIDLPSDRVHPKKRRRPLAAGHVPIAVGLAASPLALAASLGLAALLPMPFLPIVVLYLVTSAAYTFVFKKKLMADVLCLAGLYTLRIVAGGAATGIPMTPWLLAFSMFLFLSLAFAKRYTELQTLGSLPAGERIPGRGYRPVDLEMVRSVGPASGFAAILVVCLYVNDAHSALLYHHPMWLWLVCPVLLYWISRIWFLAQRGEMPTDPVVFALTDPQSWVSALICGGVALAATLG